MRAAAKFGLVTAGYVAAFVLATGSVAIYAAWADSPDRQASSGMYAFGDSLLFLALFGLASVPPTVAGLFFLRPYHSFWRVLASQRSSLPQPGLVGCVLVPTADPGPRFQSWSAFAVSGSHLPRPYARPPISSAFAPLRHE
jgi:hypothetical protein